MVDLIEIESRDVTFLEVTFPRQGEISQDLFLYEIMDQGGLPHSSGRILGEEGNTSRISPMDETNDANPIPNGNIDPSGSNYGLIPSGSNIRIDLTSSQQGLEESQI